MPPETCSIMLLAKMVALVKQVTIKLFPTGNYYYIAWNEEFWTGLFQSSDAGDVRATFAQFARSTVNEEEALAHKLLGSQFEVQLDVMRTLLTEALYEEQIEQVSESPPPAMPKQ